MLPCRKVRAAPKEILVGSKHPQQQERQRTLRRGAGAGAGSGFVAGASYCRISSLFLFIAFLAFVFVPPTTPSIEYSTLQLGYESVLLTKGSNATEEQDDVSTTSGNNSQQGDKIATNNNSNVPTNLRIVFVGDSVSRYMYLSLAYYLKYHEWAPRGHTFLEKVKDSSPDAWNEWLAYTHRILDGSGQGHGSGSGAGNDGGDGDSKGGTIRTSEEICDCYRYWTHPFQWYKHCENRYYHDHDETTKGNNYVSFITKFGGNPFHGHVAADQVFQEKGIGGGQGGNDSTNNINQTVRPYDWVYPTWDRLVDEYLARWNPKPTILLFNQGHWKAHELRDVKVLKKMKRVLKKHGIRGIYRTTTFRQDERVVVATTTTTTTMTNSSSSIVDEAATAAASYQAYRHASTRKHDALVCQYFECLNVSWTAGISTSDYVDPVHFKAPINNRMNQQFLEEFIFPHQSVK